MIVLSQKRAFQFNRDGQTAIASSACCCEPQVLTTTAARGVDGMAWTGSLRHGISPSWTGIFACDNGDQNPAQERFFRWCSASKASLTPTRSLFDPSQLPQLQQGHTKALLLFRPPDVQAPQHSSDGIRQAHPICVPMCGVSWMSTIAIRNTESAAGDFRSQGGNGCTRSTKTAWWNWRSDVYDYSRWW